MTCWFIYEMCLLLLLMRYVYDMRLLWVMEQNTVIISLYNATNSFYDESDTWWKKMGRSWRLLSGQMKPKIRRVVLVFYGSLHVLEQQKNQVGCVSSTVATFTNTFTVSFISTVRSLSTCKMLQFVKKLSHHIEKYSHNINISNLSHHINIWLHHYKELVKPYEELFAPVPHPLQGALYCIGCSLAWF